MPWNTIIGAGIFVVIPVAIITAIVYFIKRKKGCPKHPGKWMKNE
ncbi:MULTISPECIES: hypothetical protein [Bacillus]|nr:MULTISPECIES: hypothetical protein [Bacillus]